jgi:multiple sugar transport system substrate-binding protein
MKTIRNLLTILVLVSLFLSACTPAATKTETTTATEEAGVQPAEQVTIRIWDFGGAEFDWIDSMAIPEFNKKYPNITVEHLGIPESDYSTKVDTAITANDVPDIALMSYMYKLWKPDMCCPSEITWPKMD